MKTKIQKKCSKATGEASKTSERYACWPNQVSETPKRKKFADSEDFRDRSAEQLLQYCEL